MKIELMDNYLKQLNPRESCRWEVDKESIEYFVSSCDSEVIYEIELLKCFSYCPACGKAIEITDEWKVSH
jgi:acetyl-CoA carboxylase beta subunit